MRRFGALMVAGAAICGLACAQPGLELIQPDAGLVLGIQWKKILDSPVGATLNEQIQKASPMPAQFERLQEILRQDLDSIFLAAPAAGLAKNSNPPMLAVVKGRFDAAQMRELTKILSPKIESYHSVDVMSFPDVKAITGKTPAAPPAKVMETMRMAFLDNATILMGDGAEVRAAIDRAKSGRLTAPRKGILAGADALVSSNDIWMLLDIPPTVMKDAPPAAQMFSGVRGMEFGISFQRGFGMQLNLNGKDAASASSLAQAAQGFIAMAAMSKDQSPETVALLRKIRIAPEGARVTMALNLDRDEVQKLIEAAKAAQANSAVHPAAKSPEPVRAPEPPGPKTIRITGLESGTVEVPYNAPK